MVDETKARSPPVFVSRPEPVTVEEGEWARFCCRVTGHPKPRVMWVINGNTIVNVSSRRDGTMQLFVALKVEMFILFKKHYLFCFGH